MRPLLFAVAIAALTGCAMTGPVATPSNEVVDNIEGGIAAARIATRFVDGDERKYLQAGIRVAERLLVAYEADPEIDCRDVLAAARDEFGERERLVIDEILTAGNPMEMTWVDVANILAAILEVDDDGE